MTSETKETELLPCPFCGGAAEIIDIDEGENEGGSCVSCTKCEASSHLEFGRKENLVSCWNTRAALSRAPEDQELGSSTRMTSPASRSPEPLSDGEG